MRFDAAEHPTATVEEHHHAGQPTALAGDVGPEDAQRQVIAVGPPDDPVLDPADLGERAVLLGLDCVAPHLGGGHLGRQTEPVVLHLLQDRGGL